MDWPGWDKIAKKAVKEALDAMTVEIGGHVVSFQEFVALLREGKIAEVVRCGECRWGKPYGKLIGCENENCGHSPASLVEDDWFCADGERRDETE